MPEVKGAMNNPKTIQPVPSRDTNLPISLAIFVPLETVFIIVIASVNNLTVNSCCTINCSLLLRTFALLSSSTELMVLFGEKKQS